MALVDLWKSSPVQLQDKDVRQIITFAGSGNLLDGNSTSMEFRSFLSIVPSSNLEKYADECLKIRFDANGFCLQDIVNQVGRRLDFDVIDGRYRGTSNHIGFDGLWRSKSGHSIVVEVKTSDAYRIDMGTIAGYRRSLLKKGEFAEESSSVLMVVGRQDTGDLEAQIRGSRHAWDIRLISVDSLLRLMRLREEMDNPDNVRRIHEILIPHEYTKVDGIIDLMFSTAADVRQEETAEPDETVDAPSGVPRPARASFGDECVARIQQQLGRVLIKKSRTLYVTDDSSLALVCSVSREHGDAEHPAYWFSFHPYQREPLEDTQEGLVALGCGSARTILLIPIADVLGWLDGTWQTVREDRMYWHLRVQREGNKLLLDQRKGIQRIDLAKYVLN